MYCEYKHGRVKKNVWRNFRKVLVGIQQPLTWAS
jgi:hypothetical protein